MLQIDSKNHSETDLPLFRDILPEGILFGFGIGSIDAISTDLQSSIHAGFLESLLFYGTSVLFYGAAMGAGFFLLALLARAAGWVMKDSVLGDMARRSTKVLGWGLFGAAFFVSLLKLKIGFSNQWSVLVFPVAGVLLAAIRALIPRFLLSRSRVKTVSLKHLFHIFGGFIFLWAGSFTYLFFHSGSAPTSELGGSVSRPNVVLVVIDTLRADHLSCYGYQGKTSPNMDAIAAKGSIFTNHICQQPITTPSHVSLFTSTYPMANGVEGNNVPLDEEGLTLAEVLKQNGYSTAAFVSGYPLKAHASGLARGFDLYDDRFFFVDYMPGKVPFLLMGLMPLRVTEKILAMTHSLLHLQRRGDRTTEEVLKWLEKSAREPFFIWVHYFDPHTPYSPPPPYNTHFDPDYSGQIKGDMETIKAIWDREILPAKEDIDHLISLYDGEILFTDYQIGRLEEKLREAGVLENTLFIITADHGESLWEHEYYFSHGDFLYDSCLKIPLIIRLPGQQTVVTQKVERPTENMDIVPTILDFLGIMTPETMTGQSLLPSILGQPPETPPRAGFSQAMGAGQGVENPVETMRYCLRTPQWKLIKNDKGRDELYFLEKDPRETSNLIQTDSRRASRLEELLWEKMASIEKSDREESQLDPATLEKLKSLGYIR